MSDSSGGGIRMLKLPLFFVTFFRRASIDTWRIYQKSQIFDRWKWKFIHVGHVLVDTRMISACDLIWLGFANVHFVSHCSQSEILPSCQDFFVW